MFASLAQSINTLKAASSRSSWNLITVSTHEVATIYHICPFSGAANLSVARASKVERKKKNSLIFLPFRRTFPVPSSKQTHIHREFHPIGCKMPGFLLSAAADSLAAASHYRSTGNSVRRNLISHFHSTINWFDNAFDTIPRLSGWRHTHTHTYISTEIEVAWCMVLMESCHKAVNSCKKNGLRFFVVAKRGSGERSSVEPIVKAPAFAAIVTLDLSMIWVWFRIAHFR